MDIKEYIDRVGTDTLIKKLKVNKSTISNWYNFKAVPRPHTMVKIVKSSQGFITYEEIIVPFVKKNKKR